MKREEAFALHMNSLFNDCVNNETGLLRRVAERLDPAVTDDTHGSIKDFLFRCCETQQKKLARAKDDIRNFVGGEDTYRRLAKEDFDAGYTISASAWRTSPVQREISPDELHDLFVKIKDAVFACDDTQTLLLIEEVYFTTGMASTLVRIAAQLSLEYSNEGRTPDLTTHFCELVEKFGL